MTSLERSLAEYHSGNYKSFSSLDELFSDLDRDETESGSNDD